MGCVNHQQFCCCCSSRLRISNSQQKERQKRQTDPWEFLVLFENRIIEMWAADVTAEHAVMLGFGSSWGCGAAMETRNLICELKKKERNLKRGGQGCMCNGSLWKRYMFLSFPTSSISCETKLKQKSWHHQRSHPFLLGSSRHCSTQSFSFVSSGLIQRSVAFAKSHSNQAERKVFLLPNKCWYQTRAKHSYPKQSGSFWQWTFTL